MAHGLVEALRRADWIGPVPLAIRRVLLSLPIKDLGGALAVARACVTQTDLSLQAHRAGEGYQLKRLRDHHAQAHDALRALEAVEEMNQRDRRVDAVRGTMQTHMTVAAVGKAAIVGVPGELFVELGLALKRNRSFAPTIVAGYCNDLVGYLPTRAAYAEGGYEVETARLAEGSGEMIVARALNELDTIAAEASSRR